MRCQLLLLTLAVSAAAQTYTIRTVAGGGPVPGQAATTIPIGYCNGLAVDQSGHVYMADYNHNQVVVIDAAGKVTQTIGAFAAYNHAVDGGPAATAQFGYPGPLALDNQGNLYIGDSFSVGYVRKVNLTAGTITTVAGAASQGSIADRIPATQAALSDVAGLAVDSHGNLFIAESLNNLVRRVDAVTGMITTVAGTGTSGYNGDNILATAAELNGPGGLAFDANDNLFIADGYNARIRKITSATGMISTVAGTGTSGYNGDGIPALSAHLNEPNGLTIDSAGNLYIADAVNERIRKVTAATGLISTVAGSGGTGHSGDGGLATSAMITSPEWVALDASGNLFLEEGSVVTAWVREVMAASGNIATIAGNGTSDYSGENIPATGAGAEFNPSSLALDGSGNLFIADGNQQLAREVSAGTIRTVAGTPSGGGSTADNIPATSAAFPRLSDIAVDAPGNLYISVSGDGLYGTGDCRIRKVAAGTGIVTTFAGTGQCAYGGENVSAATTTLNFPGSLAIDAVGDVYIAESHLTFSGYQGCRIRKISSATGKITTVAGNGTCGYIGDSMLAVNTELGQAQVVVDSAGNLWIADAQNSRVRKIDAGTGIITTVAGNGTAGFSGDNGSANLAELNVVFTIAVDPRGNLFISDSANNRIRRVDAATRIVTTIAGNGNDGFNGDIQPATSSTIVPDEVEVDADGNVYFLDHMRVRELSPQAMVNVSINSSPAGQTILVDQSSITTPQTFHWVVGSNHTVDASGARPAGSGTQLVFSSWSQGGAASQTITAPAADTTYAANFNQQYQLTIAASPAAGGTVTPASGGFYDNGTVVPVAASANPGYSFNGWTGGVANPANPSTSVVMSAPATLTANFSSLSGITIQTNPPGLQFSVDGQAPQAAPKTLNLTQGSHTIAVAATQPGSAGTQYVFTAWSDSGAASHSIAVSASAATYTASFRTQYQLTTMVSPQAAGTVTPAGGAFYDSGAVVTVTATPATGYSFMNWTGPVTNSTSASTALTMTAPQTVTANFTAASSHPAFFGGEVALGNGVYYLQFPNGQLFGYYSYLSGAFIYHFDLGYEYVSPAPGSTAYLYDFASGHWWYTGASLFPTLYDFTLGAWIFYFPDTNNPGRYTANPRYFANLQTSQIFRM